MTEASPIYIIAEIASAHEGDPDVAIRLARRAAGTGADAVKFQIFSRDALLSRVHPKFANFGAIQIETTRWPEILDAAGEGGVDVIVEAFDDASLDLSERSGRVAGYKIPTSDIGNARLMRAAITTGKRLHVGVGGATEDEIACAVSWLREADADAVLMHGFQAYPTPLEDTNLARLAWLKARYGYAVGYADHVDAEEAELARLIPAMAISAGATVIEKHITEDRGRKGRDHHSALEPSEFRGFVELIRRIEPVIGTTDPELTEAEIRYRHEMKRQAVAASNIPAGTPLAHEHVAFKRIGKAGLAPRELEPLIGHRLKTAKSADEPITAEDF